MFWPGARRERWAKSIEKSYWKISQKPNIYLPHQDSIDRKSGENVVDICGYGMIN
jgi:hypothetical protein